MVQAYERLGNSVIAVQEVPLDHVKRYGIVAGVADGDRLLKVQHIVEKPSPDKAPSRLAVAGRYILSHAVFGHIRKQGKGAGGELQLTDGIAGLLADEVVHAYTYQGKRYDCGSKEGFLEATVELALQHHEVGESFRGYLKSLQL
jgi:UTP--glucose-1-phosphate uridylyltransferase